MAFETTDDLANTIADWLGIYGCCKSNGDEGCEYNPERPFCCRYALVGDLKERMTKAVEIEKLVDGYYDKAST